MLERMTGLRVTYSLCREVWSFAIGGTIAVCEWKQKIR